MTTLPDTLALIGNTPLVRLKGPSEAAGAEIFGKGGGNEGVEIEAGQGKGHGLGVSGTRLARHPESG